jgi:hypothetical protein
MDEKIAAVRRALEETEAEYAQMPMVVRLMVRRGFVKRTGHDFAGWRKLLDGAARGIYAAQLSASLAALSDHYRGAPARAKRGMGASPAQLETVEERSQARAAVVDALRGALAS